ncbi:putative unusual protein kinase [Gaiella occulta]|uniref:Putative unusual protein kinase n=1 Tax=Gaiella occulta TaxID=1002870 RepID=A0A7M2YZS5_9ACTN|nr:AarF/ABC1/UbiB kinase family protein [Gaiella occulta]RDI74982.1 putative unusual protein kinase [Gaiella occulta]
MSPVRPQRKIGRLSEIGRVATRHGFGYLVDRRRRDDRREPADRGRRLREMLDELGPTFVKFGQLLSTRPDLVPPDIVAELRGLQDDVSPFPFAQVREVVETELGLTVEQAFTAFDEHPIAAASIGQVHRATLPNGQQVVVKVQRPAAPRQVESDLQLMRSAARVVRERVRALDFIDAEALVEEFARSIHQELDYGNEARNAETFRRNFGDSEQVVVPKVIRPYSGERVLTLEYLEGAQFADLDLESRSPEERRELAYRMTDAWMTMIFRHGFFHGDPHPANILLLEDGRIGLVDFGLAGRLTEEDMTRLTRLFVDAATENVEALPRRLSELGLRYPKEREDELRAAIEDLYYRYYGSSLSEIDPIEVIREGLDLIYSLNLRLPSRFVVLDKTIATLGAVGIELYPEFNVFEVARPYARGLLADRFSPRRMSLRAQHEVRELAGIARELPYQARDVLEQARQGQLELQLRNPGLDDLAYHIDHALNRLAVALIVLGGLVGSSIVGVLAKEGPRVMGLHALSFVGFVISSLFGLWLVWGIARSGRL